MEFFHTLKDLLKTGNPKDKIVSTKEFLRLYFEDKVTFDHSHNPKIFSSPSYESHLNVIKATKMKKRSSLSTTHGKAYLLHSIAHIEYSAIDLALDHAYRFTNMPKEFYDDWLEVADEEIEHFKMCEAVLEKHGYSYGDFEVHSFLFDISMRTLKLSQRMAVVPRYLEAAGLDANPLMIEKLKKFDDAMAKEMIDALEVILRDEVDHVRKGDRWFKWACEDEGIDSSSYLDIVEASLPGASRKKGYLNVDARREAGFSCVEIKRLGDVECSE